MNIWIFNHYALTPNLPGGTRHFDFGKELVKRGYKVTIFSSSFHYGLLKETKEYIDKPYLIEDYDSIKFVWIKTTPYSKNDWKRVINMLSYSIRAYKIKKSINVEKPDIIIGSSVHLFAVFTAYLLSKYYKVPFIMEVRDLWPQVLIDVGVSKWHPFVIFLGILGKFLYKRAIRIIALFPKAYEYMEPLGIHREKIVWIPNGVNLERFNNTKLESNENKKFFLLGYAGVIGNVNNLDIAIKSAELLKDNFPNIKFVFVGDGPEKERLLDIVRKKRLDNVEFVNAVEKTKIPFILYSFDILFLCFKNLKAYKYGVSHNKLFDYLVSGKPIVFSSNSSNNPIEEAKAGITVPPDDPEELARAIISLYNMSEEERRKMGENGRKYVEKYHSIPILVDKLEKVIKNTLSIYEKSKN